MHEKDTHEHHRCTTFAHGTQGNQARRPLQVLMESVDELRHTSSEDPSLEASTEACITRTVRSSPNLHFFCFFKLRLEQYTRNLHDHHTNHTHQNKNARHGHDKYTNTRTLLDIFLARTHTFHDAYTDCSRQFCDAHTQQAMGDDYSNRGSASPPRLLALGDFSAGQQTTSELLFRKTTGV